MDGEWLSREDCASRFDISTRTLLNWEQERWFPVDGRRGRKWNFTAIQAARGSVSTKYDPRGSSRSYSGPDADDLQGRKLRAEIRRQEALAIQDELEAARDSGLLLPRYSVESTLSVLFSDVRRYFEELEGLTHQITPDENGVITSETVKSWLYDRNDTFQTQLADKIYSMLEQLGEVAEIRDLFEMHGQPPEAPADELEVVGRKVNRKNPRRGKDKPG